MDTKRERKWATEYLLDPLTAPEPNQLDGPGTSFFNPQRNLSIRTKGKEPARPGTKMTLPTPPQSASPSRSAFHPSNPFASSHEQSGLSDTDWAPASSILGDDSSVGSSSRAGPSVGRSKSVRQPPQARHSRGPSWDQAGLHRSTSAATGGLKRNGSISQRYPGDMSHRPLDMIKRENRAADRAPHLRRRCLPSTDTIDSLDQSAFGGAYHHGGPYDATLASRNANTMYSPLDAVRDSNEEAIMATPKEYLKDSLTKRVPLQGTATVPPGMTDMSGQPMEYREGADLMREGTAAGGAYKRWDGIPYHPDDLKGKGEPSYTMERDLKVRDARYRKHRTSQSTGDVEFEMQPQDRKDRGTTVRQRSISVAGGDGQQGTSSSAAQFGTSSDVRRSNTTSRNFGEGLKRRLGSLRRRNVHSDA